MKNKTKVNLLLSKIITGKTTTFLIKKKSNSSHGGITKLTDVFKKTPCGLIFKSDTGMGATTLELRAKRNSIIVEPIKVTASSKAIKEGAYYVGSETKLHPKKFSSTELKKYINDPKIKYKKIIVVADSLTKVIDLIGPSVYKDFFLLLDEIDSFQLDSVYRKSMENALDHYIMFPEKNRAMLSATSLFFSDTRLKDEKVSYINYDVKDRRDILVLPTNSTDILGVAFEQIKQKITSAPEEKLFIAYNTVEGCLSLSNKLVKDGVLSNKDINICCSQRSSKRVGNYYCELDSEKLPSKVNFFTSAYFTGFDINEPYHLIIVSSIVRHMYAISDKRIKQIAGRCRVTSGLISETIIHDHIQKAETSRTTFEEYISAAQIQIQGINCLKKNISRSRIYKKMIGSFNDQIMDFFQTSRSKYSRFDINNDLVISYLNIDAAIEAERVAVEIYSSYDGLTNILSVENNVTKEYAISTVTVDKTNSIIQQRNDEVLNIIERLRLCKSQYQVINLLKEPNITSLQKRIASKYSSLINYVDNPRMLQLIEDSLLDKPQNKKFESLILSALFRILPESDHRVSRLNHYFPIGQKLTKETLVSRMKVYLEEVNLAGLIGEKYKAPFIIDMLSGAYRKTDKKTGLEYYTITGKDKYNVPIVKKIPDLMPEEVEEKLSLFSSFGQ